MPPSSSPSSLDAEGDGDATDATLTELELEADGEVCVLATAEEVMVRDGDDVLTEAEAVAVATGDDVLTEAEAVPVAETVESEIETAGVEETGIDVAGMVGGGRGAPNSDATHRTYIQGQSIGSFNNSNRRTSPI